MNLFSVIIICTLIIDCTFAKESLSIEEEFKEFKLKFNKVYKSVEEEKIKFETFKENCEKFKVHNENETMKFKIGINRDADLSYEQIFYRQRPVPE